MPGLGFGERLAHVRFAGVLPAEPDVVERIAGKDRRFLRHIGKAGAPFGRIDIAGIEPVEPDGAGLRIEEAQKHAEDRRLAGARRTNQRYQFAWLGLERDLLERRAFGAGVVEGDALQLDVAGDDRGHRFGIGRRGDIGFLGEDLDRALGRARGAHRVAEDFRHGGEAANPEYRQQHELDEGAGRHFA